MIQIIDNLCSHGNLLQSKQQMDEQPLLYHTRTATAGQIGDCQQCSDKCTSLTEFKRGHLPAGPGTSHAPYQTSVLTASVKIKCIFHWQIRSPLSALCLKQVEIVIGFLNLGGSLQENAHGLLYSEKTLYVDLSPNQSCNYTVFSFIAKLI